MPDRDAPSIVIPAKAGIHGSATGNRKSGFWPSPEGRPGIVVLSPAPPVSAEKFQAPSL